MNSLLGSCCGIAQYCSTLIDNSLQYCSIAQYRNTTPKVSSYIPILYELTFGVVLQYCAIYLTAMIVDFTGNIFFDVCLTDSFIFIADIFCQQDVTTPSIKTIVDTLGLGYCSATQCTLSLNLLVEPHLPPGHWNLTSS